MGVARRRESAYGKVCVASSLSSVPEVGGDFALYIDPHNLHSGYEVIVKLISNPTYLAELEHRIKTSFVPRTWSDVARNFYQSIDTQLALLPQAEPQRVLYAPTLPPGLLIEMKWLRDSGQRRQEYPGNPERLMLIDGWRMIEDSGTWLQDREATVRFTSPYEVGTDISLLLLISSGPWVDEAYTLHVWASNDGRGDEPHSPTHYAKQIPRDKRCWVKLRGRVEDGNLVTIQLRIDGPPITAIHGGPLPIALRLHSYGYAAIDDFEMQVELLENLEAHLMKLQK